MKNKIGTLYLLLILLSREMKKEKKRTNFDASFCNE